MKFQLTTPFSPQGDQKPAIEQLSKGLDDKRKHQILYGVTGSGKTFTVASVIEKTQRPTLVISHNKTLAWQLYQEFKEFFGENAVHYFVSYYDYYQPEAYIPASDTYIEKDAQINEKIDAMRHAAVQGILTRNDVIVIASVSCIYSLGSPDTYQEVSWSVSEGLHINRTDTLKHITALGFTRNDTDPRPGMFSARGNLVKIYPASGSEPIQLHIGNTQIERIVTHEGPQKSVYLFPANFWITPQDKLKIAILNIQTELDKRLALLKEQGRDIPAYRLQQKTLYDVDMIQELGYCNGIENYSSHLEFRKSGTPPFTLIDYFPTNFLTVVDESHITIPQIRGMYGGDQSRKKTLIEHGFRLPSALDNRPLSFEEWEDKIHQRLYVSATPGDYEMKRAKKQVAEQLIRPTGIVDPPIEVRSTEHQMQDALREIQEVKSRGERVFVVTITKRLAEDIAEYLAGKKLKVNYIHSEVNTLTRPVLMNQLRTGEFDVLVGVNLLREGLDIPEVSLVIIFDADKEGFLRNRTTLLQTIGRAARNVNGRVIMYGDRTTDSMKQAIQETDRRRAKQEAYNKKYKITPRSIVKKIYETPEEEVEKTKKDAYQQTVQDASLTELNKQMKRAVKELNFEEAAFLRDEIAKYNKK